LTHSTQKILVNGIEYDLYPAQVISVDYSGLNKEYVYSIRCTLMGPYITTDSQNVIVAKPLDVNIKNIPISGEIVMVMRAPNAYNSPARNSSDYYYTNAVSLQGSVHHNGLPGVTELLPIKNSANEETRKNAEDGVTVKSSELEEVTSTIDPLFPERLDVYPLQPYPGDILIEGRFGQSIRFGSTINENNRYPLSPYWKEGTGASGNPIIIISNGTNPKRDKKYNTFILENIDEDDSGIWLTSGQSISFTPGSRFSVSIEDKGADLYRRNGYAGNQAIMASDRIILNARKQELIGFGKEAIAFSSDNIFSIDSRNLFEVESKRINFGLNADEPVLLGNTTGTWFLDLCDLMKQMVNEIKLITVPTGVGPSGTPINAANFTKINSNIQALSDRIEELKSKFVYVNKKSVSG
jgi:hypothetical protein